LLRAAYLPFSVFGLLLQSTTTVLLPVAARRALPELWSLVRTVTPLLTVGSAIWALLLVTSPDDLGRLLLGDVWPRTGTLRTIFGIALICQAAATAALIALSTVRSNQLLRLRLGTGVLSFGGGVVLALAWGPVGVASAIAAADALAATGGLLALHRAAAGPSPGPQAPTTCTRHGGT
jgi:hypothetical protein